MEENWFNKSIEQTEKDLETNIKNGLNKEQVEKAREKYGLNELKAKKKKSLIIKFLEETNGKENGTATGKDLSWMSFKRFGF